MTDQGFALVDAAITDQPVVRQLLELYLHDFSPGDWQVRQMASNARATEFWRRAIPIAIEKR